MVISKIMSEKCWLLAIKKWADAECHRASLKLSQPKIARLLASASHAKSNVWKSGGNPTHQCLNVGRLHPIKLGAACLPATTQLRNDVINCKLLRIKMSAHTLRDSIKIWNVGLEQKLNSCEITHSANVA